LTATVEDAAEAAWDAVQIAPGDNVAVALRDLEKTARVRNGDRILVLPLADRIPLGHKFALADIPVGAEILKYGAVIGTASGPIASGRHVHVHNIVSRRARRRVDPAAL
jgi:hypothetical protein